MALTTGPLLSFRASGSIAKTAVYSNWRGRAYVRQHVIPKNPQSPAQTQVRQVMKYLVGSHKQEPALLHQAQEDAGNPDRITGLNIYVRANLAALKTATNLSALTFMPGLAGGLALTSAVPTAGAGQISIAVVTPTLPTGWTLNKVIADAVSSQDPHDPFAGHWAEADALTASPTIVLTGLTAAQLYRVGVFADYTQANGMHSLSPAIMSSATPT